MRISCDYFANFVADFRTTFVPSVAQRENFYVSRTSREMVAKVLNMFKNFMRIFSPKYFAILSRDCRASVANLSPRIFGKFSMQNFRDTRTNVVRVSYDDRTTVLRKHANTSRLSGEKIKLKLVSHWHANFSRLFCDCRSTFVRVSRTSRGEILANLQCGIFATLVRMSCECRTTVTRQS